MKAMISLKNVSLCYPLLSRSAGRPSEQTDNHRNRIEYSASGRPKAVRALQDINLECHPGDRLAVMGQNGSGKTTLLHVIAKLLPPDKGTVSIEGRLTSLININLGIQMQASGHRNITLRGLAIGASRQEIESKREEIAAFSELGEFLDFPVETYSAGMRMRLAFAIVTAFDPEVLLMDEWISTGDQSFRAKATARMNTFADNASIMVLASHSTPLMRETCNRGLWMAEGRIVADGPIEEVIAAYQNNAPTL